MSHGSGHGHRGHRRNGIQSTLEELADDSHLTDAQKKAVTRFRESLDPDWESKIVYDRAEIPLKSDDKHDLGIYQFSKYNHSTALDKVEEHLGKGDDATDENVHDILEEYVLQHVKHIGDEGRVAVAIYEATEFKSEDERESELLKLLREHLGIDVQRNQAQAQKYQQIKAGLKAGEKKEQIEALDTLQEELKKGLLGRHKQIRQNEFYAALPTEIQRSAVHLRYAAESDYLDLPKNEKKFQELYQRGEAAHAGLVSDILKQRRDEKLQARISGVKYKRAG